MLISKRALERLQIEFDKLASHPFPELPEADDLADLATGLLLLDPEVAAKVMRVLNGNMSKKDFIKLREAHEDLQLLRAELENLDRRKFDEVDVIEGMLNYVYILCQITEQALCFDNR